MVKCNSEGSGDEVERSATPAQSNGIHVSGGNTNALAEDLPKKFQGSGIDNQHDDLMGSSTNELVNESMETTEKISSVPLKDQKHEKETHCKKDHMSGELNAGQESAEVAAETNTVASEDGKATASAEDLAAFGQANEESCQITKSEFEKEGCDSVSDNVKAIVQPQVVQKVAGDDKTIEEVETIEKELSTTSRNDESLPREISSDAVNDSECKGGEGCPVEGDPVFPEQQGPKADTIQIHGSTKTEGSESKRESHLQEAKLPSKPDTFPEVSQAPAQPHHIPSQAPPVPPPQPQHFLIQQQFMGLQQQFLQMQQQRQVLVQQYQQLQQQLHQAGGQDPVLAGQVMAVQSQGQVLQQQMLQAWQQMQLIQQQLQLAGAPQQQPIAIQQQQQSQLGPQWPAQGHPMGAQPGAFPIRPGVVGLQHPLQPGLPVADKVRSV